MKLHINGDVNRTFCQNLCLIFFPGAKFPENEPENGNLPEVFIETRENSGIIVSDAIIAMSSIRTHGHGETRVRDFVSRDRAIKTSVGMAMLEAGGKMNGSLPPWGILTGVRPAKIAAEMKGRGLDREGIVSALMSEFRVREDKARLLADVNATEERAVMLAARDTCSLYISIPFCPTRCAYCSFVSYATPAYLATLPEYLDVLCRDIGRVCREIKENGERLLTVYIGGGTPTVLDAKQLDRLLSAVRNGIGDTKLLEFTVEAGRPDTVTAEKFDVLLSHGVDRTSINPQILDDGVLKLIGRRHTAYDFYRAYDIAKRSGIGCINTDLIAGLPGADYRMFADTVDRIIALEPENVTVHTYCVKRAAEFTERAAVGGDTLGIYSYTGGDTSECVDNSQKALYSNGYLPYYLYRQKNAQGNLENVGFSKPGHEGLYNIFIMEELQNIRAVGAGAVTKLIGGEKEKIKRIFEPKYSYEYLKEHGKGN